MDFRGKRVLVVGLARTGRECARFLVSRGAGVWLSDRRPEQELKEEMENLAGFPMEYRLGGEDRSWLDAMDLVVPSPGVPATNPLLEEAIKRGVEVMSEIELAYRFLSAPLIAVTGTNGKSTTTTLLGEILTANDCKGFVGGNIGAPLIGFVDGDWEWGVVEISSFQLEWTRRFRPRIAVLLNVTEDHLDRHATFSDYRRAKEKIFQAQSEEDWAVLNRDDPLVWAMRHRLRSRVLPFGFTEVPEGVFAAEGELVWRLDHREERFPLARVKIRGVHNLENMMAAIAAAKAAGIPARAIQQALEAFPGLPHRLEFVRDKDGVRYYDDSKGTNVGAVVKSLASFSAPLILIAGGVDKGGDYGVLQAGIRQNVKRLILFGAAKRTIDATLGHVTDTVLVEDLEAAVRDAVEHARPGDVVLLSPACSSFDMFRNYAERGDLFKSLVRAL